MEDVGGVVVGGDELDANVGEQIYMESLAAINLVVAGAGEVALEHFERAAQSKDDA